MSLQLAVDVSNYTGPITPEQARCLRGHGVAHLVAGTQVPALTRVQVGAALAAGMTADAYVYLYWRDGVLAQVERALAAVAGLPVGRLWLDCEDDAAGLAPAQVEALIASAIEAAGATPCGIYTGRWWWTPATGDSHRFSALPLWHAEYTGSPDVWPNFDSFRPYGGWRRPAMWQFQGTTSLCGLGVDLDLVEAVPAEGESAPAPEAVELALLRAEKRFQRALALGRFVFRPADSVGSLELQRVEDGRGVSFEPPYLLQVD
jgi:GH25 family lysozyme M1 (1,4-beta-N-acetylmuramidase)